MIYKYTLYGKVHDSERKVSYTVSIPLGLTVEKLSERLVAFSKAFTLVKLEVVAYEHGLESFLTRI